MVRVAFERVELDAVQLLEALPAALASEVVLHLGRVLLHVPSWRCGCGMVATDAAPGGEPAGGKGAGSEWAGPKEQHQGGSSRLGDGAQPLGQGRPRKGRGHLGMLWKPQRQR